jgi:hypothetical protein
MNMRSPYRCEGCRRQLSSATSICIFCSEELEAEKPSDPMTPQRFWRGLFLGVGTLFMWLGHFFLIGFPLLFLVLHFFFYRGGGTSGVPLGLSIFMAAPVSYTIGGIIIFVGKKIAPE